MAPRLSARDFDPDLLVLFDAYVHGDLDRRGFLARARKFAKAGVTAAGLLAALSPDFAAGEQVRPDDPRLKIERDTVPSPAGYGQIEGYLARPAKAGSARLPAILVVHENRGLNIHTSRTSRGDWRSTASWPSRPTRSRPWAATRATKTRPAQPSRRWTSARRCRT